MNVWFGDQHARLLSPAARLLDHVPTPVGEPCAWCAELVEAGNEGWGQSPIGPWFHEECFTRMILGSLGHQLQVCPCYGGDYEDPPALSTREAAKAALEQAQANARLPIGE